MDSHFCDEFTKLIYGIWLETLPFMREQWRFQNLLLLRNYFKLHLSGSMTQIMDNKSCFLIRSQPDKTKRESPIQLKKLKQNGRDIEFQVPNDANYKTEPMKPAKPEPAAYVP